MSHARLSPTSTPKPAHPGEPLVPTRLLHYRIRYPLGRGTTSAALLAHDERLNREVVLKVLVSPDRDPESLASEARILAQLSHPNIAGVHAVESAAGESFLVLEYVDGETLEKLLAAGPLPPAALPGLAHALLSALAHAHARGVLHCDLKPDNIMIAHDGTVKLTDFGVARLMGRSGARARGSSLYQSPEQAAGREPDGRSDLYALALVLAECVTGSRAAREPGVPLSVERVEQIAVRAPAGIDDIIRKGLAGPPAERPSSALGLLEGLQALDAGARGRPAWRWMASVGSLALALLAVAARFEWVPTGPAPDPRTLAVVCAPPVEPSQVALSEAFASALSAHLSQGHGVRLVDAPLKPREQADDVMSLAAAARARGAGSVLRVELQRRGAAVAASLTLHESRTRRLLWADAQVLEDGALSRGVATSARSVAHALGATSSPRYEWFLHLFADSLLHQDPVAMAALEAARANDLKRSFAAARAFCAAYPRAADARVMMAYAWHSANWALGPLDPATRAQYRAAIDTLRQLDPLNPWDETLDGLMLSRDGRLDDAIGTFTAVLAHPSLGPSARAALLAFRGQALRDRGDGEASLADLHAAIGLDATNVITLVMLADALGTFGREAEGLEAAERALLLSPHSSYSHIATAQALARLDRWRECEAEIRIGYRLAPSMDTRALLALALFKQGRTAEAAVEASASVRETETLWGRSVLARYHAARGDQDAAFRELSRAVRLGFADPEVERMAEFAALRGEPRFAAMWPRSRR